ESEVLGLLADLGQTQAVLELEGETVTPAQFHGIEIKPWAKEIAELVLWIGYLQWQLRTRGDAGHIAEPVLRAYGNIECRDAVLAYDRIEPVLDDAGHPVTRWDGETMKPHPVTGKDVPDETAQVPVVRYVNPRKAEWPEADFVIGNPPFLGKLHLVSALGEGYMSALRGAFVDQVPDGADLVMYWWAFASRLASENRIRRFGFVTTNSIRQVFNRRVVAAALESEPPIHLAYAIPDHPWVDSEIGAAVRIAMTVGAPRAGLGRFAVVSREAAAPEADGSLDTRLDERPGRINADLTVGADIDRVRTLRSNEGLASMGPAPGSRGFFLDRAEREALIRRDGPATEAVLRPIRNGRDLLYRPRGWFVIDLHGWSLEELRRQLPAVYQWICDRVLPERATNRDPRLRERWWLFRRSNDVWRRMLQGVGRFIITVETAKHRVFFHQDEVVVGEHGTISVGLADGCFLGMLSSRIHVTWALAAGGRLGVGNDPRYNKTRCFDPFPFPACGEGHKERIRELGEQLDAHRKRQQSLFPDLTITGMYNVLEKLRSGEPLTAKEKVIHEQGLVTVLKQLHDELDAAVFDAYGWPHDLTDEQILERLVALNAERAEEERRGLIRWLRPEFQNPGGAAPQVQTGFSAADEEGGGAPSSAPERRVWPKPLPERIAAVRDLLATSGQPWDLEAVTGTFNSARRKDVEAVLDSLASLGLILAYDSDSGRRWRAAT
ncbi:MAG TPA: hypothetical protein PLV66_00240, partial [Thermoanaerobaculales bacterium]|nr:hypothetical protein [Thermoanaerobaculales bacterium]